MNKIRYLFAAFALTLVGMISFNAAAAADAAATDSTSWVDLAKPVYDAFVGHHPALGVCLGLVLLVALVKRYAGSTSKFGAFIHGDAGGSLLVLIGSAATAAGAALGTPGAHVSLDLLKQSVLVGISAAGGYAMLKNLIVEPVLKPLAAKAPSWAQPIFSLILWIFDHPADQVTTATTNAAVAGAAAVAAKPAAGADGIAGAPTQVK